MAKTITIFTYKGGTGKTTIGVNLAACLAQRKFRVLLIDSDGQGDATSRLGFQVEADNLAVFYEKTVQGLHVELPVVEVPGIKDLWLCPGHPTLQKVGYDIYERKHDERLNQKHFILRNALKEIKSRFDYIIIDTPPDKESPLVYNALLATDYVITPVDAGGPAAMEALLSVVPLLSEINMGIYSHPCEFIGVVVNRFENDSSSRQVLSEALQWAEGKPRLIFKTRINEYKNIERAQWLNRPVTHFAPGSEAADNFKAFTKEVLDKVNNSRK